MLLVLLTALAAAAPHGPAGPLPESAPVAPPSPAAKAALEGWDIVHYVLDVDLDPDAREVVGRITVEAEARVTDPGPLLLHAADPEVEAITWSGGELAFTHSGDEVLVEVPEGIEAGGSLSFTVDYSVAPSGGGSGLQWGDPTFSFHEPEGARRWLVVFDDPADKATFQWRIGAPEEWVLIPNGTFVGQEANEDGALRRVYDFDWPSPTYLMVLHGGSYVSHEHTDGVVPITTWAKAEQLDAAAAELDSTGEIIEVLAERFGPYPWSHYANVLAPFGGAMEHTTATTFGQNLIGSGWAELVNAHEIGHHWWGDLVTCAEWEEIWLNEGFATYSEVVWVESSQGVEAAQEYRAYMKETYLEWREFEGTFALYDPVWMWGGTVYEKGGLVMHMLRHVAGDEHFFGGLRRYAEAHEHDVATSLDLQLAFEEEVGEELGWFFGPWVYEAGEPDYTWGLSWTELGEGVVQVDVHVDQAEGDWVMPVPVVVDTTDGESFEVEVWAGPGTAGAASLCLASEPVGATFDPGGDLLYGEALRIDGAFTALEDACTSGGEDGSGEEGADPDDTGGDGAGGSGGDPVSGDPEGCRGCGSPVAPGMLWMLGLLALARRRA